MHLLHLQLERSTSPEGGVFDSQYLALCILAAAVPDDWIIYVKEHPIQFTPQRFHTRHYRSQTYYDRMLEHRNVQLLSVDEPLGLLIAEAKFVATITGSVGWEALSQKKACVVFGQPWYYPCQSCYGVGSVDELQQAIAVIQQKTPADVEVEMDVLR